MRVQKEKKNSVLILENTISLLEKMKL